jgi:hypothetical protein
MHALLVLDGSMFKCSIVDTVVGRRALLLLEGRPSRPLGTRLV